MSRIYIPEVDKKVIRSLATRIRPLVRRDGKLCYIKKPRSLFTTSFLWNAAPTKVATGLKCVQQITTYHTYGHYIFFKPSVAEVLAQVEQLSAEIKESLVAFELTNSPQDATDLNREKEATNAGYHTATALLYAAA